MDFKGNYERVKSSILMAKENGASYRLGPELEITGYGCEDHFLVMDTFTHSWEIMARILNSDLLFDEVKDDPGILAFAGEVETVKKVEWKEHIDKGKYLYWIPLNKKGKHIATKELNFEMNPYPKPKVKND